MDPQLLVRELERLQTGQSGAETRVLFLVSRTNLYLLTSTDPSADNGSDALVVQARISNIGGRQTAYLFSSVEALETWARGQGCDAFSIPLHGADMALALPKGTWIAIDPDTPHATVLSPAQLEKVSDPGAMGGTDVVLAPTEDRGFQMPGAQEQDSALPSVYKPADEEIKEMAQQGPSKKKFFPRAHPTTFFAAPQIEKKDLQGPVAGRSYTSSNLKKVIRAMKPEGSEE